MFWQILWPYFQSVIILGVFITSLCVKKISLHWRCLKSLCDMWELFSLWFSGWSLPNLLSFTMHILTLIFTNKFKRNPIHTSRDISLHTCIFSNNLSWIFQPSQPLWSLILSAQLSETYELPLPAPWLR